MKGDWYSQNFLDVMEISVIGGKKNTKADARNNSDREFSKITYHQCQSGGWYKNGIISKYTLNGKFLGNPSINYLQTDHLNNEKMFLGHNNRAKFHVHKLQQIYIGFSVGIRHIIFSQHFCSLYSKLSYTFSQ